LKPTLTSFWTDATASVTCLLSRRDGARVSDPVAGVTVRPLLAVAVKLDRDVTGARD